MTQSYLSFLRPQWVNELNLVHEYATLKKNLQKPLYNHWNWLRKHKRSSILWEINIVLNKINYLVSRNQENEWNSHLYDPLIWNNNNNAEWKRSFNNKNHYQIHNENFNIMVVQMANQDLSFIVKSLVGSCPQEINIYSNISSSKLSDRLLLKYQKSFHWRSLNGPAFVHYISYQQFILLNNDFNEKNIAPKYILVMAMLYDEFPVLPKNQKGELHVHCFHVEDQVYSNEFVNNQSKILYEKYGQPGTTETHYHPIYSNTYNLKNQGPRCNSSLIYSFRSICFDEKEEV